MLYLHIIPEEISAAYSHPCELLIEESLSKRAQKQGISNGYHSNMWPPIYPIRFKTLGWGPPELSPIGTELWLPAYYLLVE